MGEKIHIPTGFGRKRAVDAAVAFSMLTESWRDRDATSAIYWMQKLEEMGIRVRPCAPQKPDITPPRGGL